LGNLTVKYDELVMCQSIEIPIYSMGLTKPKKAKKAKLASSNMRSKSQNRVKHL
jgi:hypothetical protein